MAKENLFNILANYVDWEKSDTLDLFAGTGSLGFEMLSRGARSVTAIERDEAHAAFIRQTAETLGDPGYKVIHYDVLKWLRRLAVKEPSEVPSYQVIVADPPYDLAQLSDLPQLIREAHILAEGGLYVQEHPKEVDFSDDPDFVEMRHYGAVHFSFFRSNNPGH